MAQAATMFCSLTGSNSSQSCILPSTPNPFDITSLPDLSITYFTNLLSDQDTASNYNDVVCPIASTLLPLSNLSLLDTIIADPTQLSIGFLDLVTFARTTFPYPTNTSGAGDIVSWWVNATISDPLAASSFIRTIVDDCAWSYCRSIYISIGNPDIVGIGMLTSTTMLMLLAFTFSVLSFGPIVHLITRPEQKTKYSFRVSFLGTLDDLFQAVLVFGISVIVSGFVFRYHTDSHFDALMADGLAMLCSTTVVMLAASYWAHNKPRPYVAWCVAAVAVLTVALFATHHTVVSIRASPVERACGTDGRNWSQTEGDGGADVVVRDADFNASHFNFIPLGFACWCLVAFGAVFHHPVVKRRWKPRPGRSVGYVVYVIVESLPSFFGLLGLAIYLAYFWHTWRLMKSVYGDAFTKAEKTWGFGQYLAVATWLPVFLQFGHLFMSGMEPVLATRLPRAWSATPSGGMKGRGRKVGDGHDSYVTWQPMTKEAKETVQRFDVATVRDPERGG
ncbi:hypothetical protein BR93DRAFT_975696 [Coniochaeta sp. PMI_546]|nr:hypothetical protein BR93DRAFT_975696 [Coniochaeta sp. PMI_546]